MGAKIPIETVEGLLVNVLNQSRQINETTLLTQAETMRIANEMVLREIRDTNIRLIEEMKRSNEALVTQLRSLIFPDTAVPMQHSYTTEEAEDAQFAFDQGWIDKDQLEEIMGGIEVAYEDLD